MLPSFGGYRELIARHGRIIAFGFAMMFFSSPGQTYFISLFGGFIREDLNLSHGQFGSLYSVATLLSAVCLLYSGCFIDRVELPQLACTLAIGIGLAFVLLALSSKVWMLFAAFVLLRQLGQGLMSMTQSTALMRYVPFDKAKANSLSNLGYSVSEAAMPSMIVATILLLGWRHAGLLIAAIWVFLVPLVLNLLLSGHKQRHQDYLDQLDNVDELPDKAKQRILHWTQAQVLRDPYFYLLIPALVSQSMLFTGIIFHQVHFVEQKGWSLVTWGALFSLYAVFSITSSVTMGAIADKTGALKWVPLVMLPMTLGLLGFACFDSIWMAALFLIAMAISTGSQSALTAPFLVERYGTRYLGSIKSLSTFAMVFSSGLSPALLGWALDQGLGVNTISLICAAYASIVVIIAIFAVRRLQNPNYRD